VQGGLLVVGLALVAYFVWSTGPRHVFEALSDAGPFVPLLAVLEMLVIFTDIAAFVTLLGPDARRVTWRGWLRSSSLAYGCSILLPAGRTASEAARASVLGAYVGGVRAATAAAQLQASALVADGFISGVAALVVVGLERTHRLPALLAGNLLLTVVGGGVLLVLIRNRRVALALGRRFPRLFARLAAGEGDPYTWGLGACAWSYVGRVIQVVEFGIAVLAVGGSFNMSTAFVAFGIHAVSATIGVAVPNQVGVADGAYVLFADTLGFENAPARALAVMLSVRVMQVALALICFFVPLLVRVAKSERPSPGD
jgi:hypothetical protein